MMMYSKKLDFILECGLNAPRLEEQLQTKGWELDLDRTYRGWLQRMLDRIEELKTFKFLTPAETKRAYQRVLKKIEKHAVPIQ